MSGVGSRETGLDSLFASEPVGPGFEPPRPISQAGWSAETTLSVCQQAESQCCIQRMHCPRTMHALSCGTNSAEDSNKQLLPNGLRWLPGGLPYVCLQDREVLCIGSLWRVIISS